MGSAFGYHLCNAPYRYRYFLWMHRISGWPDNPVAFNIRYRTGTDMRLDRYRIQARYGIRFAKSSWFFINRALSFLLTRSATEDLCH